MAWGHVVSYGYLVGTVLLIPSTTLLLSTFAAYYSQGIWCLIVATGVLTLAALVALVDGCCLNDGAPCRPRRGRNVDTLAANLLSEVAGAIAKDVENGRSSAGTAAEKEPPTFPPCWNMVYLWMMVQGGALFLAASCMCVQQ